MIDDYDDNDDVDCDDDERWLFDQNILINLPLLEEASGADTISVWFQLTIHLPKLVSSDDSFGSGTNFACWDQTIWPPLKRDDSDHYDDSDDGCDHDDSDDDNNHDDYNSDDENWW